MLLNDPDAYHNFVYGSYVSTSVYPTPLRTPPAVQRTINTQGHSIRLLTQTIVPIVIDDID